MEAGMDYRDYRDDDDRYREPYWNRPLPYRAGGRAYDRDPGYRDEPYPRGEFDEYRRQPRGLMERATDEMRSWFGDERAERRRQGDDREWMQREHGGDRGRWSEREPR